MESHRAYTMHFMGFLKQRGYLSRLKSCNSDMNELLQKHGCANVFSVPEGLKELMSDISREVLRSQPPDIYSFIANYLSVLLITREHGVMAVKILDDLCDCRPSVVEHLTQIGFDNGQAQLLADIIKEEIETLEEELGKETVKEYQIIKKILARRPLDEVTTAKICQIARNAYRDYWYRKKNLEKSLKTKTDEPWEIAAQHTLELYKRTKPSFSEMNRAAEKIQAAYRGYHVRRNILRHLKPKTKKRGPKVELPGPPLDIAGSREIDLGPIINIQVREDNVSEMFDRHTTRALGLPYDPMKTITHVSDDEEYPDEDMDYPIVRDRASRVSGIPSKVPITDEKASRVPSAQSQMLSKMSQMERSSRAPSLVLSLISEGARQSRLPSQTEARQSRLPSQTADPGNLKISFSSVPPEVIPDAIEAVAEGDQDIKEILAPESEITEADAGESEVPEDIQDDQTEADVKSALTASVPSSAPDTANTTDVEFEVGEDLNTTDEEG